MAVTKIALLLTATSAHITIAGAVTG